MAVNTMLIDNACRLQLPAHAVREIGSRPLQLVCHSDRHLLLAAAPESAGGVILTGSLGDVTVTDLLSFFNMFRKTGVLRFGMAGGSRDIYFQQGEITFAASSFPDEDLGEILHDLGKVDRDLLQKARQAAAPGKTLGKVLVDKGAVTAKDLWEAARHQAEMIVYNLFAFSQGNYAFFAQPQAGGEVVRLSMSTQNLIMEGLRRVDERALFLRRIGSLEALPVATDKPADGLSVTERRILGLVGEGKTRVREVLYRGGVGEFGGLRILYQLVEKGFVHMEEAQDTPVKGELGEVLNIFNGILTAIYRQVTARAPDFSTEIRQFLRDLPHPFSFVFRDCPIQSDGSVDGGRILANLAGLEGADQKKLLIDALNELIYMECIVARRELGTVESAELVQRVQEISRRVKNLIGRKR
jgi:hypothetical protein